MSTEHDSSMKDISITYHPTTAKINRAFLVTIKPIHINYRNIKLNIDNGIFLISDVMFFYKIFLACLDFIERYIDELDLNKINTEMITKDQNVNFLLMNVDKFQKIKDIILKIRNGDFNELRKAKIQSTQETSLSIGNFVGKNVIILEKEDKTLVVLMEAFIISRFIMFDIKDTFFYNIVFLEKDFMDKVIKKIVEMISKIDMKISFIKREALIRTKEAEVKGMENMIKDKEESFRKKEITYLREIYKLRNDLENALGKRLPISNPNENIEEL